MLFSFFFVCLLLSLQSPACIRADRLKPSKVGSRLVPRQRLGWVRDSEGRVRWGKCLLQELSLLSCTTHFLLKWSLVCGVYSLLIWCVYLRSHTALPLSCRVDLRSFTLALCPVEGGRPMSECVGRTWKSYNGLIYCWFVLLWIQRQTSAILGNTPEEAVRRVRVRVCSPSHLLPYLLLPTCPPSISSIILSLLFHTASLKGAIILKRKHCSTSCKLHTD